MEFTWLAVGVVIAGILAALVLWRRPKPSAEDKSDTSLLLLQEQLQNLTHRLDERLDKSQVQMRDSMSQQFQQSSRLISEITEKLTKLDETNKRVVDVTTELKTLQNVLQNPKQRGVIGEYYLQTILENCLPPDGFAMQYQFKNGEAVDAVIFLDSKVVPVDSKFSLENYNRIIEESNTETRDSLIKQFKFDLKTRIDETAKYIRPNEDTMDFAFMFIPSEAIYYDLLINKIGVVKTASRDLIEYAFGKRVIIVSPTSFMAYLQTVIQGLRALQIEKQTLSIRKNVVKLQDHLKRYQDYHLKVGNSLRTVVSHYNESHKQFRLIDQDIVRIAETEPQVEALQIEKPMDED